MSCSRSIAARAAAGLALLASILITPVQAQPAPGYYDTADPSSPAALRSTLHEIIDDHTRFPYTSSATDTWDILEIADEDQDDSGNVITVYRNASYPKQGGGNSYYNREHSWPKSYGFPDDGSGNYPYTDTHHLFIADSGYNSSRSNKPYRNCDATCSEKATDANNGRGGAGGPHPGDSNWTSGSYTQGIWETWSGRRGDVARALFYMDVRYEGGTHGISGADEPDLILTDDLNLIEQSNTGNNESVAHMGLLSVLLQWHAEDPVDLIEFQHAEAAAVFQGNRNPFVDHPEWVECVFAANCDPASGGGSGGGGSGGGSSSAWINEFHYDNQGGDKKEAVEVAGAAGTDLGGWTVVAYNGSNGSAYSTTALSGVINDQQGCTGTINVNISGLQNGAPDGIALVDASGGVVEFISYEGVMTATDGPATGLTSVDVGVQETSGTPSGYSLQLGGTGSAAADFAWQAPQNHSRGEVNAGQTFDGCGDVTPPAAPTGLVTSGLDSQVLVDWDANAEPDLAGYNVYRATLSAGPYDLLNGSLLAGNSFTDTSAVNGVTYYYVVTAQDEAGNESANSSQSSATPQAAAAGNVWINEIHYDNAGGDVGEFVEVAGAAGNDLAGWQIVAYNGNGGASYATVNLTGVLSNQSGGYGTLPFDFAGLQNGAPDGIALVNSSGTVVEFLSYEGSFTATSGPAIGLQSQNIGEAESSATPIGHSLQRTGSGTAGADFTWAAPAQDTYGQPNTGQSF